MRKEAFQKFKYGFGDDLANILLTLSLPIFRGLSLKTLAFMSKIIGSMAFYCIKKYRERVIGNLRVAFGKEKNLRELKSLVRDIFFHFTLTPLETIYLIANAFPLERFILKIGIKGKENLEKGLAQKKGVIALGAHLGSFTLLGSRLAVEGYAVNIIINRGNFPKVWKRLDAYQGIVGQKTFPPHPAPASIKKALNCLHRNEILYLVADEQQRRRGLPVSFFGQKAFTPPGPAIFSLKTGAPILPMFVLRENGIQRTLVIGNPITIERTFDEKKDIEALTVQFTKVIEEMVRQHPSQWTWLNRRWKWLNQKGPLTEE